MTLSIQDDRTPFLILGHRGSPTRFRENTIRSLEAALEEGADGFECDLRKLADETVALFHDDEHEGTRVEELTHPRLDASVEQLGLVEHVLAFDRGVAVLEIKSRGVEHMLAARLPRSPSRTIVSSFDHRLIRELARMRPDIPAGLVLSGYMIGTGSYVASLGASWFFPHHRHVDAELVDDCHAHGVRVIPWSPNRPDQWARLRSAGCDGVITDLPREAVEWRNA